MPTSTIPGYSGRQKRLGAALGISLTTSRSYTAIGPGVRAVSLTATTFGTATSAAQVSLNPFLTVLKTTDALVTAPTNYSEAAQDSDAAALVDLSALPTLANGGAVYVGAMAPFSGMYLDIVNGSGGAGAMGVTYWDGSAWTNITPTDNTTNANADGEVTWTVPTAWAKAKIQTANALGSPVRGDSEMYWVRWVTSSAYDATTTLQSIFAISQYVSAVQELPQNGSFSTQIDRAYNGGCIQANMQASTGLLLATGYVNP